MSGLNLGGSGRIFQDIRGLDEIFLTKGSPAGPQEIRTEVGVIYVYDLEGALRRQAATQNVESVSLAAGGASTTNGVIFSFPTDHRIIAASVQVSVLPANFVAAGLTLRPFADPSSLQVGLWEAANLITNPAGFPTANVVLPTFFDLGNRFVRRETDYTFNVRSGAGGDTTVVLSLFVTNEGDGTGLML